HVYILSLVVHKQRALDILQQTNLVLLKKAREFQAGTNFGAWACRVAFYEVMADRKRAKREKLVFDDDVLNLLAEDAQQQLGQLDERVVALDECLKQLTSSQRRTLIERYSPGGSVQAIAKATGRTPNAVSMSLHRLRSALADCVQRKLQSHPA
ncbi:MAG: sigma-70 family RNA polymerase sigma factor, partial [Planctomycetota bacterium]